MLRFSWIGLACSLPLMTTIWHSFAHRNAFVVASSVKSTSMEVGRSPQASRNVVTQSKWQERRRVVQVQVFHRHGDRTPITPMKNETFWAGELPAPEVMDGVAMGTALLVGDVKRNTHKAMGRGPFGQLTQLGLLQMVDLGRTLREQIFWEGEGNDDHDDEEQVADEDGVWNENRGRLYTRENPLVPGRVRVVSTDFPRTIASVRGVLVGLFPDGIPENDVIEIDIRHTDRMIPDPQPRRTQEQQHLEKILTQRPHIAKREAELYGLSVLITDKLKPYLADDYMDVSFGVGEEKESGNGGGGGPPAKPLSWSQMKEVLKCLKVRGMVPPDISDEDQETIATHAGWTWFENLRQPRLAQLAMGDFLHEILQVLDSGKQQDANQPNLYLYSAHDSTLMGLICALKLEAPSVWPEYGSFIKIELIEVEKHLEDAPIPKVDFYVRFSLNGEILRCGWDASPAGPAEMIPLSQLVSAVAQEYEALDAKSSSGKAEQSTAAVTEL